MFWRPQSRRWGLHLPDRSHLDRPVPRPGDLRGHFDSLVEVVAVDKVKPAHLLLRFGKRTVGGQHFTLSDLHGGGVGGGPQSLTAQQHAATAHFLAELPVFGQYGGPLFGSERSHCALVDADQECIPHGLLLGRRSITDTTNAHRPDGQPCSHNRSRRSGPPARASIHRGPLQRATETRPSIAPFGWSS